MADPRGTSHKGIAPRTTLAASWRRLEITWC